MPIRDAKPYIFAPHGLTDAFDESDSFPGACRSLSNLIFDSSNPDQVVARPGVGLPSTSFATFTAPTFVSIQQTIGDTTYGMVASGHYAGFDEPFAFNNLSNTFITISGVTGTNLPASQATIGDWIPPTMSSVSTKLLITHPGFSGTGVNFFGVLDVSNPSAPVWSSSNLATYPLPGVPSSVANYNNRAYFSIGNTSYFSDSLNPLMRTNSTQSVTLGDITPITAQSGLPLQTTSSGVTAALIIFKGNSVWLVTGDPSPAPGNLAIGFVSLTVGCPAPRSVVSTPMGIIFIAQDSVYVVTLSGILSELRNPNGLASDIRIPFQNAIYPTRIAAAYAGAIYRACVQTSIGGVQQTNDYWFDFRRMRWTGPHSFVYDCASQHNESFVLSGIGTGAALFNSAVVDTTNNTLYNDNGTPIASNLISTSLADGNEMEFKQTIESCIDLTSGGVSVLFNLTAQDEYGNILGTTSITTPTPGGLWGSFSWGDGTVYAPSRFNPHRYDIGWNIPVVWDRMNLNIYAVSSSDVSIGKFKMHYQDCGYSLHAPVLPGAIPAPNLQPAGSILDINFILDRSILV
jgi:hypothetical protein